MKAQDSMKAQDLLEHHAPVWREATRHPFLDAVRDGTLSWQAFATWLAHDYLFVRDVLSCQARLLTRAPRTDQAVLARGLVAIEAELSWFEEQAERRGLDLQAPRHPTSAAYRVFLLNIEHEPYPAAITALWALERAYLEAWRGATPGHPEYRKFVEHWTTPDFAEYVTELEQAADRALGSGDERERVEAAFLDVARLERDFWEMAFSGGEALALAH